MSDRELLEAAAKAAGIVGEYRTEHLCWHDDWQDVTAIFLPDDAGWWNPLSSDADAFRLAVKLRIDVSHGSSMVAAERSRPVEVGAVEGYQADPYAATRKAIVRAAAEIGRSMKDE